MALSKSLLFGFLFFLSACFCKTFAQQDPQFSQFMLNKMIYNPGFTGIDEVLNTTFIGRNQWMGFDGQPVTQMLCVDAPVPTGGLGFTVMSDQIGAQKTSAFALNYAFRLLLPNSGSIAAGFSAGWLQNTLDGQVYRAPDGSYEGGAMVHNDNMIPVNKVSAGTFDLGFGVYLNMKNFYAGVSATHLLAPSTIFSLSSGSLEISYNRNIYFMGGYNYEINKTLSLRPSLMYKTDLVSSQVDLNVNLVYQGNLWGGVSYRGLTASSSDALILLAGINITNQIALGYSYDVTTSGIRNYSSGSHEIVFNYKLLALGKKGAKLIYCPRFL